MDGEENEMWVVLNLQPLGAGGCGDVYVGRRSDNGQLVVVKYLRAYRDPRALRMFRREIRILKLRLKGLVPLLAENLRAQPPYYIMPHFARGPLTALAGHLSPADVKVLARELVVSLAALHAARIAHGDLKPDNIFVDARDHDLGSYVADAQRAVAAKVSFPQGYYAVWSGQFEYHERARQRLMIVVPLTLLIILQLLYLNFRRMTETLIVMLSLPFSLVGGLWLVSWMGFNLSVAVAVGFIALAGVAAETGVVMLIYLDHALKERHGGGRTCGAAAQFTGPQRRGDGPHSRALAAPDDDRRRHHGRPVAHHVEHRDGVGGDAAHRRADDGRNGVLDTPNVDRHPSAVRDRERMVAAENCSQVSTAFSSWHGLRI